jgi:hypothetical protein
VERHRSPLNHYRILGVETYAESPVIRKAWIAAARKVHPDQLGDVPAVERLVAEARMLEVNEAWRVLSDAKLRTEHDRSLRRGEKRDAAARPVPAKTRPPQMAEDSLQLEVRSKRAAVLLRIVPWLLAVAFLLGLLILTANGTSGRSDPGSETTLCAVIDEAGEAEIVRCAADHNAESERPVLIDRMLDCEPGASRLDVGDSVLCFRLLD